MDWAYEKESRFSKVTWGLGYLGLMGYIIATVTYRLPIGEASMIVGLVGVLLEPRRIRLPRFLVLFGLFLSMATSTTGQMGFVDGAAQFLKVFCGGIVLGLVVGYCAGIVDRLLVAAVAVFLKPEQSLDYGVFPDHLECS